MKFIEETEAAWSAAQLAAAEREIEEQKREWEENRLAAMREEEERRVREMEEESELLTFSREDASNQVSSKLKKKLKLKRKLKGIRGHMQNAIKTRNKVKILGNQEVKMKPRKITLRKRKMLREMRKEKSYEEVEKSFGSNSEEVADNSNDSQLNNVTVNGDTDASVKSLNNCDGDSNSNFDSSDDDIPLIQKTPPSNRIDSNSPRTRSRGTVAINLWTLDVSPILPGVKPIKGSPSSGRRERLNKVKEVEKDESDEEKEKDKNKEVEVKHKDFESIKQKGNEVTKHKGDEVNKRKGNEVIKHKSNEAVKQKVNDNTKQKSTEVDKQKGHEVIKTKEVDKDQKDFHAKQKEVQNESEIEITQKESTKLLKTPNSGIKKITRSAKLYIDEKELLMLPLKRKNRKRGLNSPSSQTQSSKEKCTTKEIEETLENIVSLPDKICNVKKSDDATNFNSDTIKEKVCKVLVTDIVSSGEINKYLCNNTIDLQREEENETNAQNFENSVKINDANIINKNEDDINKSETYTETKSETSIGIHTETNIGNISEINIKTITDTNIQNKYVNEDPINNILNELKETEDDEKEKVHVIEEKNEQKEINSTDLETGCNKKEKKQKKISVKSPEFKKTPKRRIVLKFNKKRERSGNTLDSWLQKSRDFAENEKKIDNDEQSDKDIMLKIYDKDSKVQVTDKEKIVEIISDNEKRVEDISNNEKSKVGSVEKIKIESISNKYKNVKDFMDERKIMKVTFDANTTETTNKLENSTECNGGEDKEGTCSKIDNLDKVDLEQEQLLSDNFCKNKNLANDNFKCENIHKNKYEKEKQNVQSKVVKTLSVTAEEFQLLNDESSHVKDKNSLTKNKSSILKNESSVEKDEGSLVKNKNTLVKGESSYLTDVSVGKDESSFMENKNSLLEQSLVKNDNSLGIDECYDLKDEDSLLKYESSFLKEKTFLEKDESSLFNDKSSTPLLFRKVKDSSTNNENLIIESESPDDSDKLLLVKDEGESFKDRSSIKNKSIDFSDDKLDSNDESLLLCEDSLLVNEESEENLLLEESLLKEDDHECEEYANENRDVKRKDLKSTNDDKNMNSDKSEGLHNIENLQKDEILFFNKDGDENLLLEKKLLKEDDHEYKEYSKESIDVKGRELKAIENDNVNLDKSKSLHKNIENLQENILAENIDTENLQTETSHIENLDTEKIHTGNLHVNIENLSTNESSDSTNKNVQSKDDLDKNFECLHKNNDSLNEKGENIDTSDESLPRNFENLDTSDENFVTCVENLDTSDEKLVTGDENVGSDNKNLDICDKNLHVKDENFLTNNKKIHINKDLGSNDEDLQIKHLLKSEQSSNIRDKSLCMKQD